MTLLKLLPRLPGANELPSHHIMYIMYMYRYASYAGTQVNMLRCNLEAH